MFGSVWCGLVWFVWNDLLWWINAWNCLVLSDFVKISWIGCIRLNRDYFCIGLFRLIQFVFFCIFFCLVRLYLVWAGWLGSIWLYLICFGLVLPVKLVLFYFGLVFVFLTCFGLVYLVWLDSTFFCLVSLL